MKINANNRQKDNYKYEYAQIPLHDLASKYIYIPLSVIMDNQLDVKRVCVLSYLRIHNCLNNVVAFTIPDMVEWCGFKVNKRANCSNDKFLNMVDVLNDKGYLTYLTDKSKSSFMKCKFNIDYYYKECENGYAVIYLDEIEKILNYKKENEKDGTLTNATLLLVFAYFRNKIKRRPNELKPEEESVDKIKQRKEKLPEAYNGNISDIAEEIGIHKQTLSKAIDILENELHLIVTDRAYRVRNGDGEFRTLPTLFANAYKREGTCLLDTGKNYSENELKLKAKQMQKYFKGYKLISGSKK